MRAKNSISVKKHGGSTDTHKLRERLPLGQKFIDNGDGTVTDLSTGLMWAKDMHSAGCNHGKMLTWQGAMQYAKSLSFAGYSDWRLPSIKELVSIADYSKLSPAIHGIFKGTPCGYFWSGSNFKSDTRGAWVVGFDTGRVNGDDKSEFFYIRCVRDAAKMR